MLSFLNREQKSQRKIRRTPHLLFGISIDTPQQFRNEKTMLSPYTFNKSRLAFYSPLTHKTDLSQIEEDNFLSRKNDKNWLNKKTRYLSSYYEEYSKNNLRFRRQKGQFTTTIDSKTTLKLKQSAHRQRFLDSKRMSKYNSTFHNNQIKSEQKYDKLTSNQNVYEKYIFKNDKSVSKLLPDKSVSTLLEQKSFSLVSKDKKTIELQKQIKYRKTKNIKPLDHYKIHKERLSLRDSFYATIQERKKTKRYSFALPVLIPEPNQSYL